MNLTMRRLLVVVALAVAKECRMHEGLCSLCTKHEGHCRPDPACLSACNGTAAERLRAWELTRPSAPQKRMDIIKQDKHDEPADVGACAVPCARVAKAAVDGRVRFAYPAGLEHTGHHLWQQNVFPVIDPFYGGQTALARAIIDMESPKPPPTASRVARLAKEFEKALKNRGELLASGAKPKRAGRWHRLEKQSVVGELTRRYGVPADRAIVGLTACSYPCQPCRHDPDVRVTAEAAELAGADLRVMVMTRPVAEVLHSTSNGRVCLMERSCAALARQLEALDPAFYFCFPYGPESPQGAGDFLGTTDAALQDIVAAIYKPDDGRIPVSDEVAGLVSPRCFASLTNCSARIDALCKARHEA